MRDNRLLFYLYAAGVMVLLLNSMHVYFLWELTESSVFCFLLDVIVAIIGVVYIIYRGVPIVFSRKTIIPFLLIWIASVWHPSNFSWVIFKCPLSLFTILLLDKLSLRRLLAIWTNMYAAILLVSLVAWPLALLGILPSQGFVSFADEDGYYFSNHILVLVNFNLQQFDVVRFNSIFLEPGHIAMIGAFNLYLNCFDLKKWSTWVFLATILVSLSLAGYVLLFLAFIMIKIQQDSFRKSLRALFGAIVVIVIGFSVALLYNGGDNLVNDMIVERLEADDEKIIAGNNRTFGYTDDTFNRLLSSSDIFTGLNREEYDRFMRSKDIGGAGYKIYILEVGILGTIIVLIGYLLMAGKALNKRFVYFFLLLYIFAFIQRAWPTFHIWLYLFVFSTAVEPIKAKVKSNVKKRMYRGSLQYI